MAFEILNPNRNRKVKGVLFDMDGLVLDTEKLYSRFWMEAAHELGYPMTFEQALGMRSLNKKFSTAYLETLFGPGIDYDTMRAVRIRRMDAWIDVHGVEPKPGIYELLDYLHKEKIPCAITTSSPSARIKAYLTPQKLYDQFDAICSGYEVEHGKPEPDIYLYGASKIQTAPKDCLALEDSPAGIESGYRAGCMAVMIPDQDQPSSETKKLCFAKADSLKDIIDIIKKLNFEN